MCKIKKYEKKTPQMFYAILKTNVFETHRPSICRCMCFFRRTSWLNELEHIVHRYLNSWCITMCWLRWAIWRNFSSQILHSYGKLKPCVFKCWCRCVCCLNVLSGHWGQKNPLKPLCRSRCWFNDVTCVKRRGHWLHTYCWILWCDFMWLFRLVTCN